MSVDAFGYKRPLEGNTFTVDPIEEHREYRVFKLTYDSPVKTKYPRNNEVVNYVYKPNGEPRRAVVILHCLHEKTRLTQRIISLYLVSHNFCAINFTLPYHLERTPKWHKSGDIFLTTNPKQNFEAYRQSVVDLRLLADFLESMDIRSIGITGVSLGALVLNTLMGIDKRFRAGVPIAGGGGLHYIVVKGIKGISLKYAYIKRQNGDGKSFEELNTIFHNYIKKVWETNTVLEPPSSDEEWFLIDPLTYAKFNSPRKIFMINGAIDLVVPRVGVEEFRSAVGNPPIVWLPSFHTTTVLLLPFVVGKMVEFFEESL